MFSVKLVIIVATVTVIITIILTVVFPKMCSENISPVRYSSHGGSVAEIHGNFFILHIKMCMNNGTYEKPLTRKIFNTDQLDCLNMCGPWFLHNTVTLDLLLKAHIKELIPRE